MRKKRSILWVILLVFIAGAAFVAGQISEKAGRSGPQPPAVAPKGGPSSKPAAGKRKILYWRAPMDPNYISKKPGKSPMGMDLVPVYGNEEPAKKSAAPTGSASKKPAAPAGSAAKKPQGKGKILYYRDPMDPNFISNKPGKAPCGMDLVPVYANEVTSGGVRISPTVVQEIGVTTTKVVSAPFSSPIRTYGTSTWNEESKAAVNTKIKGWIEKLDVNVAGQRVQKGQPLLQIYSPQLVSAQQEYLAALDNARELKGISLKAMAGAASKLPEAAYMRLKLWDISGRQIAQLRRTRKIRRTLTLYAPFSGIVTKLDAVQGDYVMPGQNLMKIASLDPVWVNAFIYEDQIPMVEKGMKATVTFDALPGETFTGKVAYVYPYVEGKARTTQVRIVLPNPKKDILPQMYGSVKIQGKVTDDSVQIPSNAVIRSSPTDNVVFIALGNGHFAGRKVILGPEGNDGMVMVKAGLTAGERVVTSAQFLLDSESRLNSAIQAMLNHGGHSK